MSEPVVPAPSSPDDFWEALVETSHDLPALLRVIADRVTATLGDGCVLTTLDDESQVLEPQVIVHADPQVARAMQAVLRAEPIRVGEGLAGTVAADRRPIMLNDLPPATVTKTTPARFLPFVRDHPMRAVAIVPLVAAGELVGTLGSVRTDSEAPYTPADLRLLEGLAEQAALAIAGARAGPRAVSAADFEAVYRHTFDGVLLATPDGHILAANPAACRILGRTEREIMHGGRDALVVAEDPRLADALAERTATGYVRAQLDLRRGDGSTFPAEFSSAIYTSPDHAVRAVTIFRDISVEVAEREQLHARLDELIEAADRDPLTGLWNRRGFGAAAAHALAEADRDELVSHLVLLDLDGLKAINDAHGHSAGDAAIVSVAVAIREALREVDVACRLGGDEFVFLAVDTTATSIDPILERIDLALASTGPPGPLTCSSGVVERAPRAAVALDELIDAADRDMYQRRVLRRLGAAD